MPDAARPLELVPWKDLERAAGGGWRATGPDPQFLIHASFPPGWVRIRLAMAAACPGWLELRAAPGDEACVLRVEAQGAADVDHCAYFSSPVSTLRLDPLDGPGEFRLDRLEVRPLGLVRALGRAAAAKFALVRKYRHTGAALQRALGMLARGDFARLWRALFRSLNGPDFEFREPYDDDAAYAAWCSAGALTDADRERLRAEAAALAAPPRFAVLLALSAGRDADVRRSVESVLAQTYDEWELLVTPDAAGGVRPALADYTRRDARVHVVDAPGLAAASADYVLLLDEGDALAEHALSLLGRAAADGRPDLVYADEDRLTPDGHRVRPYFKPGWSPDLLLSWMYTGRPAAYRTDRVRRLGGFRANFGPAQEYDLVLRLAASAPHVARVPDVLYHRGAPDAAAATADAARAALRSHLETTGREGTVEAGPRPGLHCVRFAVRGEPAVSLVIASACRPVRVRGENTYYLLKCLESLRKSTWRRRELIVQHGGTAPPVLDRLLDAEGAVRAAYDAPFNWSRAMNQGAALARAEHLLFLNDDVEVITPDWIERLLEFSQQAEVGAVGATLLFPGGRLQHAGVAVVGGLPLHPFYGRHAEHPGYFNGLLVPRNCSAVTGACLMTRAAVFHAAGGFDEAFPLNYNDVDYGLRLVASGLRVVCTPHARLYHHELGTRTAEVHPREREALRRRWGEAWEDPFCNPNLSPERLDYIATPPAAAAQAAAAAGAPTCPT
jgi:GT2 family glycosyltransferase